jgi:hypothetical protein
MWTASHSDNLICFQAASEQYEQTAKHIIISKIFLGYQQSTA